MAHKLGKEIFVGITDLQYVLLGEALMNHADKFGDKETAVLNLAKKLGHTEAVTYITECRKLREKMQTEMYT